jgi:flagellar hook-associated protein 3 FlgL
MRIATKSLYVGIQQRIMNLASNLKKVSEQVASGKNISRPSDNPVSMVSALGLSNALSQMDQYRRNLDMGNLWLKTYETVIGQIAQLTDQARRIAQSIGSGGQSAEIRAVFAENVGQLLDQAISLANTKLADKYIFAGYRMRAIPFSKVTIAGIETASYNGDANDFEIQIGQNEKIAVGKNGQTLLVDPGLFDALGNLKSAIETNDLNLINQQVNILQGVEDDLNAKVSDIGVRQNRLKVKEQIFVGLNKDMQDKLSDIMNINYDEAILELQQRQTAYEIALQASAKISQISLFNP